MRTPEEWASYCEEHITAGYTPGGSKRDTYRTGCETAQFLRALGVWRARDRIVDVGCGNGRLAMGLLGEPVFYIGLDVIEPCIAFCQEAFAEEPHFAFHQLDVRNSRYWPQGAEAPEATTYPIADGWASVICALSLFSHTGTLAVLERNLSEMWRILQPHGHLFATFCLCPPEPETSESEKRTIYRREDVLALLAPWCILAERSMPSGCAQTGFHAVKP